MNYHHGDLRRALLQAARETIREKGASGLTLRAVARAAKVSHAAPYHHFPDKDALLAAVAEEGFEQLRASVSERTAGANSPADAMQESAVAYVLFAVEHPDLFRVMFGPQLAQKTAHPNLQASAQAAYGGLLDGLRESVPAAVPSGAVAQMAVASWAVTHGLAMLLVDGQVAVENATEAERMARQVTDIFWVGLSGHAFDYR